MAARSASWSITGNLLLLSATLYSTFCLATSSVTVTMDSKKGVGWVTMSFILMSDQIGYGVLVVPSAYRQLGYIGASAAILFLSVITTYTGLLLCRVRREKPNITSYKQLFREVFGNGWASGYASACVALFLFSVICSSLVVQAQAWNSFFPQTCFSRWIALAALATIVALQVRTVPRIGLISYANCIGLAIFNIYLLYSLASSVLQGNSKAGRKVPFPSDGVEAWVSVFDLVFSFAGHVVYFEMMQEMATPEE